MTEHWEITGYDGMNEIYKSTLLSTGQYSEEKIKILLQMLTARAGLSESEIVGAFARKNSQGANQLLEIRKNNEGYECGTNPHFIAQIVSK